MSLPSLAFVNAAVYDGRADSSLLKKADLIIDKGRIQALGPAGSSPLPQGCRTIDLQGKFIVPGLVDAHVHLMSDGRPKLPTTGKKAEKLVNFAKTRLGRRVFLKRMQANLERAVNAGVTTVRAVGDPFFYDVTTREAIEAGRFTGPRLLVAGKGICGSGGHGHLIFHDTDSPWACRRAVRENIREGVDLIKILNTGGVSDSRHLGEAGQVKLTLEEIRAICDEAHRAGLPVASHSQSDLGVLEALKGGVDTIEHGCDFSDEMLELFHHNPNSLRGYSAYIPTLYVGDTILDNRDHPRSPWTGVQLANCDIIRRRQRAGYKKALAAGVRIGCGTDAFVAFLPHYLTWREVVCLAKYGELTNQQALHLASLSSAEILGLDQQTGSLETGKAADFMVLPKNPLEDLTALAYPDMVCTRGKLIDQPYIKPVKGLSRGS